MIGTITESEPIIKQALEEKGGKLNMCRALEKLENRCREQGMKQNTLTSIRNLMDSMGWSAEQAMVALKIKDVEQAEYKEALKTNN